MLRIGIELNDVIRNINKQYLKYFQKAFPSVDVDDIDENDDVLAILPFENQKQKDDFVYTDYPYELFGCADSMEKNLAPNLRAWTEKLTDIEDDNVTLSFYSMNEGGLTIQATYFFLSKLGTRARKVFFPIKTEEIWNECDVVVTANSALMDGKAPDGKKVVLIKTKKNQTVKTQADLCYSSLNELMEDTMFFSKITDGKISDINDY